MSIGSKAPTSGAPLFVQPGSVAVESTEGPMSLSSSNVAPDADVPAAKNRKATARAKPNCFIIVSRHSARFPQPAVTVFGFGSVTASSNRVLATVKNSSI